jgi:hypothetical protein
LISKDKYAKKKNNILKPWVLKHLFNFSLFAIIFAQQKSMREGGLSNLTLVLEKQRFALQWAANM